VGQRVLKTKTIVGRRELNRRGRWTGQGVSKFGGPADKQNGWNRGTALVRRITYFFKPKLKPEEEWRAFFLS